jgi:ribosomal RNA-processing protein 12
MDDALAKIRSHTSSKLAHQKAPAVLLHALEATFSEQNAEKTPTAYFAAVLTTLDATLQKGAPNFGEGDVLPAELYLLALVSSFVPPPIIRLQLNTLLSLTAPLFPLLLDHAPPLRSQLAVYRSIFLSVERSQLDVQGLPQSFASILQLSADHRPKVRKKAADLIRDVLSSPPPPMLRHPYSDRVAQWVKSSLAEVSTGVLSRLGKGSNITPTDVAMHVLALLRPIVPYLPPPVSLSAS